MKYKKFSQSAGHHGNVLIAQKLVAHATSLAHKAGVDFFVFTEKEQSAGSFGARLGQAYEEVFSKGYDRVISIGNDSPDLDDQTLQKAINALAHHKAVIGPSTDGGVYLLGLTRQEFNKEIFENLGWQTNHLAEDINNQLLSSSEIYWLHELKDIDQANDLYRSLKESRSELKWILIGLSGLWSSPVSHLISILSDSHFGNTDTQRGPPTSFPTLIYT